MPFAIYRAVPIIEPNGGIERIVGRTMVASPEWPDLMARAVKEWGTDALTAHSLEEAEAWVNRPE